jgi:molecular chaperone GrpE
MTSKRKHPDQRAEEPADAAASQQAPPTDAPPAQAPPAQEEMSKLRAERDDLLSRLQRVSADYLNYQRRAQRDIAEGREYANAELIMSLLGVLLKGMELVYQKALEVLGRFGLSVIQSTGQPFDPDKHSALTEEPSGEHPPLTVLRELRRGYLLKGRTLRPALVAVSKAPPPDSPEQQQSQQEKSPTQ